VRFDIEKDVLAKDKTAPVTLKTSGKLMKKSTPS